MGRHGQPVERAPVPWELVGWGLFACAVAAGAIWWLGRSWVPALLVAGAGALCLAVVALVSVISPSRPRRPPHP